MSSREDSDSDTPEEFTSEQGVQQHEEIIRVQKENKARVVREGKERRRLWTQKLTPRPSKEHKDASKTEDDKDSQDVGDMLPTEIVEKLAAREKKVFLSDSEDEKANEKPKQKRKKRKSSGVETVILKNMSAPKGLQEGALDFLKKKKMQVSRSNSVLNNSNQALRFISSAGLLGQKN